VEIDEVAARLVRQYWVLLAVCVVLPLIIVGAIVARQPTMYAASARIITSSSVPQSASEADAIVSQVQGIATGPTAIGQALHRAGVRLSAGNFAVKDVSVTGLGTSQVIDITVTDKNPRVAQRVAQGLGTEVVDALNKVAQSGLSEALGATDAELVGLTEQQAEIAAQVSANPKDQALTAKLAGLDQVIANFTADRGRLLIQASTQGLATVLDQPSLPKAPESKALAQKLGLALLLGLVLGILLAAIAEMARPTVPGARRVSRRLNSPMLGSLSEGDLRGQRERSDSLVLQLRLAAAHAGVSNLALVDIDSQRHLDTLASALNSALPPTTSVPVAANGAAAAALSAGSRMGPATLLTERAAAVDRRTLQVSSLHQLQSQPDVGQVGIVVLSGPVARVSRILALDDLSVASGWPIVGVVGVPALRRSRPRIRRSDQPNAGSHKRASAAAPSKMLTE
jgi:capsular polysaccharide biosynthesis protein